MSALRRRSIARSPNAGFKTEGRGHFNTPKGIKLWPVDTPLKHYQRASIMRESVGVTYDVFLTRLLGLSQPLIVTSSPARDGVFNW